MIDNNHRSGKAAQIPEGQQSPLREVHGRLTVVEDKNRSSEDR
jgi:hypothetical protein